MWIARLGNRSVKLVQKFLHSILALWCLCSIAQAEELEMIIGLIDLPPSMYLDEQGKAAGYAVEDINKIMTMANIQYRYYPLPSKRLVNYFISGQVHAGLYSKNFEGLQSLSIQSHYAILQTSIDVFALRGTPLPASIDTLQGKVVMVRGHTYGPTYQYLNANDKVTILNSAANVSAALKMVQSGRGEYMLGYNHATNKILKTMNSHSFVSAPLLYFPAHLTFSNKILNLQDLVRRFDCAHQTLLNEGSIEPLQPTLVPPTPLSSSSQTSTLTCP